VTSSDSSNRKRSILEGVYEENRRIRTGEPAVRRRVSVEEAPLPVRKSRPKFVLPVAALALIAVAGLLVQVLSAESGAEMAATATFAPTPAEILPTDPLRGIAANRLQLLPERAADNRFIGHSDVPLAALFDLRVKTIVIDPGHGGRDPGAIGPNGLTEAEVTLDVAERLKRRLEQSYNYRILLTRTADTFVSLRDRVDYANAHDADLFISIHVNDLPVEDVTSIETYYFGTEADSRTLRRAERENQHADYSVAEFNAMLREVGQTMKAQESREVAVSIQRALYRNIREVNRDVADWGVKSAPFMVLLGVDSPAVLAEIAVLSNRAEEQKLGSPEYREMLAAFLEEGVAHYLMRRTAPNSLIAATPTYGQEED
jgi:N-acetylmuramoyl-L-alanine amidase